MRKKKSVNIFYLFYISNFFNKKNVNECHKGIGLETIFKNILSKDDKTINFSNSFFIFFLKVEIKTFLI